MGRRGRPPKAKPEYVTLTSDEQHYRAWYLRTVEHKTYAAIATELGTNTATAYRWVQNATAQVEKTFLLNPATALAVATARLERLSGIVNAELEGAIRDGERTYALRFASLYAQLQGQLLEAYGVSIYHTAQAQLSTKPTDGNGAGKGAKDLTIGEMLAMARERVQQRGGTTDEVVIAPPLADEDASHAH